MTLRELLQIQDEYYQNQAWAATLPPGYIKVVENLIASEQTKRQADENDPYLNAKIEAWTQEGRINFGAVNSQELWMDDEESA